MNKVDVLMTQLNTPASPISVEFNVKNEWNPRWRSLSWVFCMHFCLP